MIFIGKSIRTESYSPADLEFLFSLGNLAIISIENARLFQSAIEKQRMEDELKIAREIQQGLLPEHLPKINGFDIAAFNIPSKEVGGDYYDVIQRNDREYVLAIGDVSGKGVPASLLMANVQAVLRALAPLYIGFQNDGTDQRPCLFQYSWQQQIHNIFLGNPGLCFAQLCLFECMAQSASPCSFRQND